MFAILPFIRKEVKLQLLGYIPTISEQRVGRIRTTASLSRSNPPTHVCIYHYSLSEGMDGRTKKAARSPRPKYLGIWNRILKQLIHIESTLHIFATYEENRKNMALKAGNLLAEFHFCLSLYQHIAWVKILSFLDPCSSTN